MANWVIYGKPALGYGSMEAFLGFWGVVVGALTTFLVVKGVFALRLADRPKRIAFIGAAFILGLLGAVTAYWILWWKVPPFTLEGAWLYPLAIFPLVSAVFLGRRARGILKGRKREEEGDPQLSVQT